MNDLYKKCAFNFKDGVLFYYTNQVDSPEYIIVLPGFSGTHEDLTLMVDVFKTTHTIIIPDLPGWGSTKPLTLINSIETYADILIQLILSLKSKNVILVAHCMGCATGVYIAKTIPVLIKKLFLISPPFEEGSLIYQGLKKYTLLSLKVPSKIKPIFFIWRNRVLNTILSLFILKFRSKKDKILRIIKALNKKGEIEKVVEENFISLYNFNWDLITDVVCPIHIIHGKLDLIIPLSKIHILMKKNKNISLDIIEDAGHLPPVETPHEVGEFIKKYL